MLIFYILQLIFINFAIDLYQFFIDFDTRQNTL